MFLLKTEHYKLAQKADFHSSVNSQQLSQQDTISEFYHTVSSTKSNICGLY